MIATQNAADKTQKFLDDFKVSKPVIGLPGLGWDTPEMAAAVSPYSCSRKKNRS